MIVIGEDDEEEEQPPKPELKPSLMMRFDFAENEDEDATISKEAPNIPKKLVINIDQRKKQVLSIFTGDFKGTSENGESQNEEECIIIDEVDSENSQEKKGPVKAISLDSFPEKKVTTALIPKVKKHLKIPIVKPEKIDYVRLISLKENNSPKSEDPREMTEADQMRMRQTQYFNLEQTFLQQSKQQELSYQEVQSLQMLEEQIRAQNAILKQQMDNPDKSVIPSHLFNDFQLKLAEQHAITVAMQQQEQLDAMYSDLQKQMQEQQQMSQVSSYYQKYDPHFKEYC